MMYKNNFIVVVKCNGKILREKDGVVYLPFNSEYSIWLKNKDARKALVEIEVDGKNVLNGHKLIVDGNSSQEIKGFMRDMEETNRFKFIHKTKEIQDHRGDRIDDGLIRVTYQFEEVINIPIKPITVKGIDWSDFSNWPTYKTFAPEISTTWWDNNNFTTSNTAVYACSSTPLSDEGITVKGEKINSNYSYGNIGQLEVATYTMILQLKGQSKSKNIVKPMTVKTKMVCETCGRKNRSSNKFCFNCGTYLE